MESIAFVLIECSDEFVKKTAETLRKLKTVTDVAMLADKWKIIVKLESENMDGIRETIQWSIRKMPDIKSTLTLVEYMR